MGYRLFYYPGNASLAPHVLLEEIGAEFELVLVDRAQQGQKSPDYLRLNPNGRIPALVDDDLVLFESAAICMHLADRHPEADLAPPIRTPQRAHFYKWLVFLTNTVQAEVMTYHYPEDHTDDPAQEAAVKRVAAERTMKAWAVLEQSLGDGPYVLGEDHSACDPYLFMLASWSRTLPTPPSSLPRIRTCLEATAARPALQRAFATEGRDPGAITSGA